MPHRLESTYERGLTSVQQNCTFCEHRSSANGFRCKVAAHCSAARVLPDAVARRSPDLAMRTQSPLEVEGTGRGVCT
jgi:hypothetical protein